MNNTNKVCVFQDWLFDLTMQMQSVLILACRGPDSIAKFHPAKLLVARYRASVLKAAYSGRPLRPGEGEATTFMTMEGFDKTDAWTNVIMDAWFEHVDEIPHHYIMHLMHGAQIIACKHPDSLFRLRWMEFYYRSCQDLHLFSETEHQLDARLCDWDRKHWDEPDLQNEITTISREIDRLDRLRDVLGIALTRQKEGKNEDGPKMPLSLR